MEPMRRPARYHTPVDPLLTLSSLAHIPSMHRIANQWNHSGSRLLLILLSVSRLSIIDKHRYLVPLYSVLLSRIQNRMSAIPRNHDRALPKLPSIRFKVPLPTIKSSQPLQKFSWPSQLDRRILESLYGYGWTNEPVRR